MTIKSLNNTPKGPIEQFGLALRRLAEKLAPVDDDGLKKVGKALAWPFQKKEIEGILRSDRASESALQPLIAKRPHVRIQLLHPAF